MKQEFVQVPVEVVRELKELVYDSPRGPYLKPDRTFDEVYRALQKLPDPPKPDVVEECRRVAPILGAYETRAVLRRYRELGCPELDE